MSDWKDDLANKVANQLSRHAQETEAANDRQNLIRGGAAPVWEKAKDSIAAAMEVINKRAESKVISAKVTDDPSKREIVLSYTVAGPVMGMLTWRLPGQNIEMSVRGKPGSPREFGFAVENEQVVLKGNASTINGEGLAQEFLEMLTTP
jgi:hypothetical protein